MFDAPLPEYESPKNNGRNRRPGRRYGSSATNAALAVTGGVAVSALVFLGASAIIKTPASTTIPAVTSTTTQPAVSTQAGNGSVATKQSTPNSSGSTISTTPTTIAIPTTTTPTTVPFRGGDDNGGQFPSSGAGDGNGEGDH